MDRNLEVRHMTNLDTLVHILDTSEGWRSFLYQIPKDLNDISKHEYVLKYDGSIERLLETESAKEKTSPARLLLEEWSISGKVRPTVDHLLTLLERAKQIRAAEYLTTLLREKPPARPTEGPGAPIDVRLPEDHHTESLLNGISYPSSTMLQQNVESVTIDNNRDYYDKLGPTKRVEIEESLSSIARPGEVDGKLPLVVEGNWTSSSGLPLISALGLHEDVDALEDSFESAKLQNDRNYQPTENHVDQETPNLSILGTADNRQDGNSVEQQEDIPALSALLRDPPESQQNHSTSTNRTQDSIPMLSMLGTDSASSLDSASDSDYSGVQSVNPASSLMEFSVSPSIAEYTYEQLHDATGGFDLTPFTNGNVMSPNGRSIGVGGFGCVFLAVNLSQSVPVAAVKRLLPDKHKFREKFALEKDILSRHSHPNVVRLLGYCETGPNLCLVYEYLKDDNLEVALSMVRDNRRQMDASRRLKYLRDVASGIAFLHERVNVIHRDIKSANILLHGSVAKLCDFGLIRQADLTTVTAIIGTHSYMAPEVLRGDVSPALDVYAFGVVIAEVVTGEPVLAEQESRSDADLAGYIRRQQGNDLSTFVDRRAIQAERDEWWIAVGGRLLEISIKCLEEKCVRETIGQVLSRIERIQ